MMWPMTVGDLVTTALAVFGALAVVDKGFDITSKWLGKTPGAKADEDHKKRLDDHEHRIANLEQEISKAGRFMASESEQMEQIAESNRVTMQALLALMSHALDGNNIQALNRAKSELESYLINK